MKERLSCPDAWQLNFRHLKCSRISKAEKRVTSHKLPCLWASGWFPSISWPKNMAVIFTFKWNAVLLEPFFFPPLFLLQFYFGLAIRAGNKPNVVLLEIFQSCGQSHAALCYVWSHEQANSSISQGRPAWAQLTLLDSPGSLFCQTRRLTPRHLLCQKSLVESAQHARQLLISSCNFSKFPPQNPLQKFSLTP